MKIYTKVGDKGQTSLYGGQLVAKDNVRIEAYGTIDELNANIGLLIDVLSLDTGRQTLRMVQAELFAIGANLATQPGLKAPLPLLPQETWEALENEIDQIQDKLPPLANFILPGGHREVSTCHVCRTVCRRAERRVVSLGEIETIDPGVLVFLNRLSDYLFVLSRLVAKNHDVEEIPWRAK
ncbi:MAG: cob(I)yrinic acid a,c-diamide adenosyltransferase [Saprospiraceae bacterium]|nr:cob(I)yrinic acid a,c-diamide adenosyltransferase [Saprospiraceae bacterium]